MMFHLCNQCLSPQKLWVRTPLRRDILDATLFDQVCQCLARGWWFSPGTPVSSTNKTDCHDITEILLKVDSDLLYRGDLYAKCTLLIIYIFPRELKY
jgi:hypothetical protein